jgi:hypothetical protein
MTNELGEFEIPLDSLPIVLKLSYVGYETDTLEVNVNFFPPDFHIVMRPLVNKLPEVVVGDQAGFIVSSAVEKGIRNFNKIKYSKALYRQFDKEGGKLSTFKEILMNIKWFPGAITAIEVEGARYAEGNKGNIDFNMDGFSGYTYLLSGYVFSKEWSRFRSPLMKDGSQFYRYTIEEIIEQNGEEIAVINCKPKISIDSLSFFSGKVYISNKTFNVYKIVGSFENIGMQPKSSSIPVKIKEDILKIEVNFKPGKDSMFVFSNCSQNLSFKVKYGIITLKKIEVYSKLINYEDIFSVSTEHYKSLSSDKSSRNDLQIAKNANNYTESQWINNSVIKYTSEEAALIQKLGSEKKIKGTYFKPTNHP